MFCTDHLLQVVDGGLTELGVPGTITDEQTVIVYKQQQQRNANVMKLCEAKGRELFKAGFISVSGTCTVQRVVPGYDSNAGSPLSQAADLVVLDATVHHGDPQPSAGIENSGLLVTINSISSPCLRKHFIPNITIRLNNLY